MLLNNSHIGFDTNYIFFLSGFSIFYDILYLKNEIFLIYNKQAIIQKVSSKNILQLPQFS